MKRLIWIGFLVLLFSLPAYSQFWIHFEWNAPTCRECRWMEQTLHLSPWTAKEYHKIIHKYGRKIEHEALKDCRYWDHSAQINGFTIISVGMITRIIRTIIPHETVTGMKIRIGEEIGLMPREIGFAISMPTVGIPANIPVRHRLRHHISRHQGHLIINLFGQKSPLLLGRL